MKVVRVNYALKSCRGRLRQRGMLTTPEAADRLGVSSDTVRRWHKAGLLPGHACNDRHGSFMFEIPDPPPSLAINQTSKVKPKTGTSPELAEQRSSEVQYGTRSWIVARSTDLTKSACSNPRCQRSFASPGQRSVSSPDLRSVCRALCALQKRTGCDNVRAVPDAQLVGGRCCGAGRRRMAPGEVKPGDAEIRERRRARLLLTGHEPALDHMHGA